MSYVDLVAVGPVEEEPLAELASLLASWFGFEVRRLPPLPVPAGVYDEARGQYNSALLLTELRRILPAGAARLLAVTECDLFIPMLTFVYGQAQLGGELALLSLARLRQEFYGLSGDAAVLAQRAHKEALHEMGHTFGLVHCADRRCVMAVATGILQLDAKSDRFCPACSLLLEEGLERVRSGIPAMEEPR